MTLRHRQFFYCCCVSLIKFSYCYKFQVNIMAGSGVIKTFLSKGRKSEISLSEFCLISGDWEELGIPNLARMFLIKGY